MTTPQIDAIAADAVIAGPDPQSSPPDDEISLLDLLQVIADNLRLLVLGPLVAGLIALAISFAIPPTYTAITKFMPPQQQSTSEAALVKSLGALSGFAGSAVGVKSPNDQFVGFLKSRSVADALIDRFKLMERYGRKFKQDTRTELESLTKITSGKDGLIAVEVDDNDPIVAAQLANAYVEELGNLLRRMTITEAQLRRAFFEKQVGLTKERLSEAEQVLKASGVNNSILKLNGAAVGAVAQLQAQITIQEVKLANLRGYFSASAPEFKQALNELATLRSQLAKSESASAPPSADEADYLGRYREVRYQESLFELYARQFEVAKLDESREGAVNQVVDAAQPPERKSRPKKAQMAIVAALAAGFVLLLFVFIRQALAGANQSPESVEKLSHLRQALYSALGRTRQKDPSTAIHES
jgi:tyrosine-protein kinase Etk/Wzc